MPVFLAKILVVFVKPLLDWIYGKIYEGILYARVKSQIKNKNESAREKLENSNSKEEREDAAKDIANNF